MILRAFIGLAAAALTYAVQTLRDRAPRTAAG